MAVRDFPRAAKLLLECVATFVAGEVTSYTGLVFYAVTSALVALGRVDLKTRVSGRVVLWAGPFGRGALA